MGLTASRGPGAVALTALAAVLAGSCLVADLAPAAEADDLAGGDPYGGPSLRDALSQVHREQAGRFLAVALGSAIGLVAAGIIHSIWRRSPRAARVVAPAAIAVGTGRLLGLFLIHGQLSGPPVGALATWFFLAIMIPLAYRARLAASLRRRLPWLRAGGRARDEDAGDAERPARKREGAADLAEAERAVSEALSALDLGDVAAAEAALRRSIGTRPTKRACTYLGTLLGARGEGERALAELDRALALDPSYTEALDEKARILSSLGRAGEAEAARRMLREARAGRPERPAGPAACPACEKEVAPGAETCDCGAALGKCSRCGRADLPLRAHEGEVVCARCRAREAAGHSKGPRRVEQARVAGGPPPWHAAASFAGAVMAGAALSFVYVGWRELRASRELRALVEDAGTALSQGQAEAALPGALELRRRQIAARDGFVRNRAAMLKIALAIRGLGLAEELGGTEPEIARVSRDWAARRLAEARNALDVGDRERLEEGFEAAFLSVSGSLERLLEQRRWLAEARPEAEAGDAGGAVPDEPGPPVTRAHRGADVTGPPVTRAHRGADVTGPPVERDWRKVWARPEPGTRFLVECFRRAPGDDRGDIVGEHVGEHVGKHRDGSPLVAVDLLACEVVEPEAEAGFALAMDPVPFRVEKLENDPGPYPPAVRLVPSPESAGKPVGDGPYRIEFEAGLKFLSLHRGPKGEPELLVTRESLFAPEKLPYPRIPLFSPGIDEGWEQEERLLWLYPDAEPTRGPCVRQLVRWRPDDDGVGTRVGVQWQLRYMTRSRESGQAVAQNWTAGRPWWNIYDDGKLFCRTRFEAAAEAAGEEIEE